MGYSGYEIWFCKNGHSKKWDVYCAMSVKDWKCPICDEPLYAISHIDTTNWWETEEEAVECGFYDLSLYSIDTVHEECEHCGCTLEYYEVFDVEQIIKDGFASRVPQQDMYACWR